ncbi:MAG: RluA family pseudouridine synthase [Firmicutes bacterium]|nr:RluA family pseudouridine synthase [[Eubacterium] siraeum]MCM1487524.1 RluA family pseudouridine synthase [Bacillota bacterium]
MRRLCFTADGSFQGKKASALLTHIGCSAEIIKKLKEGGLLINGKSAFTVQILKENDVVELVFPDESPDAEPVFSERVGLLYKDGDIAVADKPPFMPIHQSPGHYGDTLANHFAALFPEHRFRAIDRLDKNTSGLCAVALNKLSAAILCKNRPQKLYYAAVKGNIPPFGRIELPIAREEGSLIKRRVCENGQRAVTEYMTVKEKDGLKLLEIRLETGRTHQIRVHLAYLGFPLLGDGLYGGDCRPINRQALHCGKMRLIHPITGERIEFSSPLPEDMARLFD